MKKVLLLVSLSLLYIPIWGFTLLDASTSNNLSIFLGLLYSVLSGHYFHDATRFKASKMEHFIFYLGPIIYTIAFLIMQPLTYYSPLSPIVWAFLLLTAGTYLTVLDGKTLFFIAFVSYFYAYHLNPTFKDLYASNLFDVREIEEKNLNFKGNLSNYLFENAKNDTIHLTTTKPYLLIETWNEGCGPCIAAMKDLQPLLDTLLPVVDHYYLYENGGTKIYATKHKIYNFPKIQNKAKILMDVENRFLKDSKMPSYPYFLLFDNKGNLIDYFRGYDARHKDYFVNRIKKMTDLQDRK